MGSECAERNSELNEVAAIVVTGKSCAAVTMQDWEEVRIRSAEDGSFARTVDSKVDDQFGLARDVAIFSDDRATEAVKFFGKIALSRAMSGEMWYAWNSGLKNCYPITVSRKDRFVAIDGFSEEDALYFNMCNL